MSIATSGDLKYAAIHEYGGTIPPHQIVPDKARALAFAIGGKQVFAARVNLPAVTMPERSYHAVVARRDGGCDPGGNERGGE